jgi:hypothetical protein
MKLNRMATLERTDLALRLRITYGSRAHRPILKYLASGQRHRLMISVNQRIVSRSLYRRPSLRAVCGGVHITTLVDKSVIERRCTWPPKPMPLRRSRAGFDDNRG